MKLHCDLCEKGPFTNQKYERHCLTQKHLQAFKAQQKEVSSSLFVCAVCAGSSFASKRNYNRHFASETHVKAMAAQQGTTVDSKKKQRVSKASEEVENYVSAKAVLPEKSNNGAAFDDSREAAMDEGLKKAAAFFSKPNITRETCACCNELCKLKDVIFIKAEGNWLERLKNRLLWKHAAYEVNERTRAYYHAPLAAVDLKGIPLAPCGIKVTVT